MGYSNYGSMTYERYIEEQYEQHLASEYDAYMQNIEECRMFGHNKSGFNKLNTFVFIRTLSCYCGNLILPVKIFN